MSYAVAAEWFYISENSPSGLKWKKPRGRVKVGDIAGIKRVNKDYWKVGFEGKSYQVHRIIYLLKTGEDPGAFQIDHINGTKDLTTLRKATASQNGANSKKQGAYGEKECSSKYKGVSKYKKNLNKPWRALIHFEGSSHYLGSYATEAEAALAYNTAAKRFFGEFAFLNPIPVN